MDPSREAMGQEGRQSIGRRSINARRSMSQVRPSMNAHREEIEDESEIQSSPHKSGTEWDEKLPTGMDQEEYKKLAFRARLKTDAVLIIMMALVVMLQYLDKVNKNYC